jgi:hypothetical protein
MGAKFDGLRGRFGSRAGLGPSSMILDDVSPFLVDGEVGLSMATLRRGAGFLFMGFSSCRAGILGCGKTSRVDEKVDS